MPDQVPIQGDTVSMTFLFPTSVAGAEAMAAAEGEHPKGKFKRGDLRSLAVFGHIISRDRGHMRVTVRFNSIPATITVELHYDTLEWTGKYWLFRGSPEQQPAEEAEPETAPQTFAEGHTQ